MADRDTSEEVLGSDAGEFTVYRTKSFEIFSGEVVDDFTEYLYW